MLFTRIIHSCICT